jgi:prepilin-type N-terminal cleavage/methylation domain-containing protein
MERRKGFTLIELMVVILIVSILAGVAIPLMQGRIDSAKWSEANAAAGTIRTAVRAYAAEKGITTAQTDLAGQTADAVLSNLGFNASDLEGTYFTDSDYTITAINADGIATISVTGSKANAPSGTYVLDASGNWTKQ